MKIVFGPMLVLLSIIWSSSAAPPVSEKEASLEMNKILEKELKQVGNRHRHHHRIPHQIQEVSNAREALSKDTYFLLRSLKKVQGHDGRSPVCKICTSNFVDAITYDYFCLPDSNGMDGDVCDRLTILGTTNSQQINAACKLLISRRPIICK